MPTSPTEADCWTALHGPAARWRRASTLRWCANQCRDPDDVGRCPCGSGAHAIEPGARYFDTGEHLVGHPDLTLQLCVSCATRRPK